MVEVEDFGLNSRGETIQVTRIGEMIDIKVLEEGQVVKRRESLTREEFEDEIRLL